MTPRSPFMSLMLALILASSVAPNLAQTQPQPASAAASPVYNVELLVFRPNASGPSEDWSNPGPRAQRGGGDTAGGTQVGRFVANLDDSQFQLSELKGRLQKSGQYQVLAHVAWSQTASSWGSRAGFTLARLGASAPGLSGLVYLERGTFLHLGMSLKFNAYDLTEIRRIRLYEKNYYDHPGLGVIALVTPQRGARPAGR